MPGFKLKILFPESRSKFYRQAVNAAREFEGYEFAGMNIVPVGDMELHEKWEYFNKLFWKVVDWKGSVIEWEGIRYHSHQDKTRIFYALQTSHLNHMCNVASEIASRRLEFVQDIPVTDYRTILN